MAIVFDAAASDGGSGGSQLTVAHTSMGSDRYALIGVWAEGGVSISSISYGAQTPSLLHAHSVGAGWLYGLAAPNTGGQTVTVNLSGTSARCFMGILSYTGVASAGTPVENEVAGGSPLTVDVSSAAGQMVVDFAVYAIDAMTFGAGQTPRIEIDDIESTFRCLGMSEEAGAATTTMSWTSAGADGWIIAVPLLAAGGGAAGRGRLVGGKLVGGNLLGRRL